MSDVSDDTSTASARSSLDLLHARADAVREELAAMRRELAQARQELSNVRTAQLLEVNAELVQAAVHADSVAQTAVSSLDELARSTQHDELTGAPTRTLMLDRLETAIAMAGRRSTRVGVIFVDLDGFKQINDSLGHAVGDQVLQMAARRMEASVRESDSVSRHGGDEFVVVCTGDATEADIDRLAAQLLAALAEPVVLDGHPCAISGSVGIAAVDAGATVATAVAAADAAMYRAKRAGRNRAAR